MKKITAYFLPLLASVILSGCSGNADVQSGINDSVSQSELSTEPFYEESSESSSEQVISDAKTVLHSIEGFYLGESYDEVFSSSNTSPDCLNTKKEFKSLLFPLLQHDRSLKYAPLFLNIHIPEVAVRRIFHIF